MARNDCYFNGINGETGSWFQDPLDLETFAERIFGSTERGAEHSEEPRSKGLAFGTKPGSLAETGWAVILPAKLDQEIRDYLQPLLDHRREAATQISEQRFQIFEYGEDEKKLDFLEVMACPDGCINGGGQPIPVDEKIKIDSAFVGSCTNGRIEDFRAFASIVKGKKKADNVTAWLVPGSHKVESAIKEEGILDILTEAGFELREPGCSACLAMNDDKVPPGKLAVSTSNRNFEGRQGPGSRTLLASPLVAAAAAVTGKVTDPRDLMKLETA